MMLEKDPCGFIKKQCDNELGRVQGPVPPEMLSSATLVTVSILTKLCLQVTATWFHIMLCALQMFGPRRNSFWLMVVCRLAHSATLQMFCTLMFVADYF